MKEQNNSESNNISSSSSGPSSSELLLNISAQKLNVNEREFYEIVNAQETILIQKYTDNQDQNDKKEIIQLFSEIFKDFYIAQEKLKACKIEKEKDFNIKIYSNVNDSRKENEIINNNEIGTKKDIINENYININNDISNKKDIINDNAININNEISTKKETINEDEININNEISTKKDTIKENEININNEISSKKDIINEDEININNEIQNNINNENDNDKEKVNNEEAEIQGIIDAILAEVFFGEPFNKYTNKFYSTCKNLAKQYLAENILNQDKKMTFVDYLEQKIFKTKLPNYLNNLLVIIITEKDEPQERYLMEPEEKRRYDEMIRKNERKEEKSEDWDLDKVLSRLDTEKEKERLKPILKEMEEDLKPKPSLLGLIRSKESCEKAFKENVAKFNIIAMNKYYMDMGHITICISGFLTEKQEHFSGWKEFVRNNNQVTLYYFLNWPSESGISSFMNFTQAKKRANYFGKILANMIISEKFFKNKKITLVGHSLGCHFIKCCIKEIAENKDDDFQGNNNKIDKIIFLGGATQIKNNKRWRDIFKKVTKCNIYNFYSKKDKALWIMQTKLVWGKKPIGRNPLLLQEIHVNNYDCGNIEFDDMLNHGYKQVYGKIVETFNL